MLVGNVSEGWGGTLVGGVEGEGEGEGRGEGGGFRGSGEGSHLRDLIENHPPVNILDSGQSNNQDWLFEMRRLLKLLTWAHFG